MPRLTADQWAEARALREAGASFEEVAKAVGVTKAAVLKTSKRDGWSDGSDVGEIIRRKVTEKVSGVVSDGNHKKKAEAIDAAADNVAGVVRQHQQEWEDHRSKFGSVPDDFEAGKLSKISAEMLSIRQKGERAAHGLEDGKLTNSNDSSSAPRFVILTELKADG